MKAVSIAPKEVPTIAVFVNLVCFIWKDNVFLNVPRDIIFKTGGVKVREYLLAPNYITSNYTIITDVYF